MSDERISGSCNHNWTYLESACPDCKAESELAAPAGSATGYKSVCELDADNPNLSE